MAFRVFQLVSLACLAALSLLYPVVESLDRWDAPGPFSDSEIQIIVLLTLVGLALLLRNLLESFAVTIRMGAWRRSGPGSDSPTHHAVFASYLGATASPPLPLRI